MTKYSRMCLCSRFHFLLCKLGFVFFPFFSSFSVHGPVETRCFSFYRTFLLVRYCFVSLCSQLFGGFLFPEERSHQIAVVTGGRFPPLQQISTYFIRSASYIFLKFEVKDISIRNAVQMSKDKEAVNIRDFT